MKRILSRRAFLQGSAAAAGGVVCFEDDPA